MGANKLSKERMAEILQNWNRRDDISPEQLEVAKHSDLLIIFGYSDDGLITQGVVDEEYGCYDGGEFVFSDTGMVIDEVESVSALLEGSDLYDYARELILKNYNEIIKKGFEVKAEFDKDGYAWIISTEVPHISYDILEDGEKFCKAIIIDLKDLK